MIVIDPLYPGGLELYGIHVTTAHRPVSLRREPAGEVFFLALSRQGFFEYLTFFTIYSTDMRFNPCTWFS